MAVIIGAGTTVVPFAGVVSVSWDFAPNLERLWELGSFDPYSERYQPTESISLTIYGGSNQTVPTAPPATSCADSPASLDISIFPATCVESVGTITGKYFLTSYSYNKGDTTSFGQESWSFQRWVEHETMPAPDYVLLGISEGQYNGTLTASEMGLTGGTIANVQGQTGSVSAGFPGLGTADDITYLYRVSSVGSSVLGDSVTTGAGKYGTASVTIPHTPVWVG